MNHTCNKPETWTVDNRNSNTVELAALAHLPMLVPLQPACTLVAVVVAVAAAAAAVELGFAH